MQIKRQRQADKYLGYLLIFFLLPVTRLLGVLLRRSHNLDKQPQHILCIKILGLGSLLLSADALREVRRRYPGCKLILLTEQNIAAGIAPFGLFDEVWVIKTDTAGKILMGGIRCLFRSWTLRGLWVADLEVYSKLTTVFALFTCAINRFGFYLAPVFFRWYLNTHNVFFNQQIFMGDNYLRMAEAITGQPVVEEAPAPVIRQTGARQFIALNNTCSGLAWVRKLPDISFEGVCRWVLEHTPYSIALLGAPGDRAQTEQFINTCGWMVPYRERVINKAGAGDFTSYYRFLAEECVCMVSIDSAPLHIARKLGLPVVSVWGPTNPVNYLKLSPEEAYLHSLHYRNELCSPCVHHTEKPPCGGDNYCMKKIKVEDITAGIEKLLRNTGSFNVSPAS